MHAKSLNSGCGLGLHKTGSFRHGFHDTMLGETLRRNNYCNHCLGVVARNPTTPVSASWGVAPHARHRTLARQGEILTSLEMQPEPLTCVRMGTGRPLYKTLHTLQKV